MKEALQQNIAIHEMVKETVTPVVKFSTGKRRKNNRKATRGRKYQKIMVVKSWFPLKYNYKFIKH